MIIVDVLTKDYWHIAGAVLVGLLLLFFIFHVVIGGIRVFFRLWRLAAGIRRSTGMPVREQRNRLRELFSSAGLGRQWKEFEDSLHDKTSAAGGHQLRATVPADAHFSMETLVDGPLHAEFYKHLPGILTGIGILGTFAGLIGGLQQFDATSSDPQVMKDALTGLFANVYEAFTVSAAAIGLAMVCTIIEKWVYAACVKKAGEVTVTLDNLFQSGVGEEYLSDLVRYSEDGALQTRQLKESLVEDLKALLTNLTDRQIAATSQLSVEIGQSIQQGLHEPLQRIADQVNRVTGEQSDRSAVLLENLMASFMAQMRESMGGQIQGLAGLLQQTAATVASVEATMRAMAQELQANSSRSFEHVQSLLAELAASMTQQQEAQRRSSQEMDSTLRSRMEETLSRIAAAQEASVEAAKAATTRAVEEMGRSVAESTAASNDSLAAARRLVEEIGQISTHSITGLEAGAARVTEAIRGTEAAADRLAAAGRAMADLHDAVRRSATELQQASAQSATGAQGLSSAMVGLQQVTGQLGNAAGLLKVEGEARAATLREIQQALSVAREASQEFKMYKAEVDAQLAAGFQQFGNSVTSILDRSLARFDQELQNAARMLADSMQELSIVVSDGADSKRRR
jgi:hypothetical protein